MTQKLAQVFDLAEMPEEEKEDIRQALANAEQITGSLPSEPLDATDGDLDELADLATESFKNIQDLGMNVEARFAAPIFDAASKMLGHAITSKLGKAQKKLKETELKLRMMKQMETKQPVGDAPVEIQAQVWDRNELIKNLKNS